jgi:uncharacterized protein (DUF4415 family)
MKKRSPDRKVKAEVARLAARPEVDVNFEDIPEIRDWSGAVRGRFFRPVKQSISLRVDRDVLAWFKSLGPGYQSRMNSVLRDCMDRARTAPGLRRGTKAQDELTKQG